ncbi:MAG: thiamine ABC transporter substrate-binding protein, partial [Microbacteriaceae bacterium]
MHFTTQPSKRLRRRTKAVLGLSVLGALSLSACSSTAEVDPNKPVELVLVTHDSFALAEGTLEKFTTETGIKVSVLASGDAGALVNQLVLTKDSPLGDVVFGIDNNLAGRAMSHGILLDYVSPELSAAEDKFLLPSDAGGKQLTPITSGDVCVNIDTTWFTEHSIAAPKTLSDLTKPEYQGMFAVPGASTSSPGLAFLLATIAEFGETGWQKYWAELVANEVKVTSGWSDAYYVDFTAGGGEGDRPIVLSYGSSPAFAPGTSSLDDTCYRQVEYAGIISGTKHEAEAQKLVDFL